MAEGVTVGVDIGGTKVAAGLVDSLGNISRHVRVPMVATGDAAAGFDSVRRAVEAVLLQAPDLRGAVSGIGLCSPGPLDPRTGVVLNPPNVPCWRNFPLAAETGRAFGLPARVENDANAAGLAEALWGAGAGYANVFYATLGTGIGAGIVFDRRIYHGRTGAAAEGGHVVIDYHGPKCGCGKRGCIEALCSGPAIAARARAAGRPDYLTAEHVAQAWREGDAVAARILEETADLLAIWLGNIVDLLEPDVMVIGGGMARLMSAFFARILESLPRWSINPRAGEIPLVMARYAADAGIAGAAALCR